MMRLGSLFTGYGGLDMAVEAWFNGRTVWTSDIDPGACKIITHRMPGIPNLCDITHIDWASAEPVDILTGGWPCQPFSHAGKRKGAADERALWPYVARAVRALRPRYVVLENVAAIASAGELARASADLASVGYVGSWRCLRASDVGAPHRRERIFIFAADADRCGRDGRAGEHGQGRSDPQDSRDAPPDTEGDGRHERRTEPARLIRRPHAALSGDAATDAAQSERRGAKPEHLGASAGPAAEPGERPSQTGGTPERMMGYLIHANTAEAGPNQALRDVREAVRAEAVQRQAGGSDEVPGAAELLPVVRQHEGRSGEGHSPLAGAEAQSVDVQSVRNGSGSARPSHRPQPCEQRPSEPANPLLLLPSETPLVGRPGEAHGRCGEGHGYGCSTWGQYSPAIHRWEILLGRLAPAPAEIGPKGGARLSPRAVEFMMGLPAGWVTDVPDLSRNAQLKALGNGVVPQQAYEALRRIHATEAAA